MARLPRGEGWNVYLATREPERLKSGVPLERLATVFKVGRRPGVVLELPHPGTLPYLSSADLRHGARPSGWVVPVGVVAEPDDLLVAEIGQRGPAVVADRTLAPGSGICVVHLEAPHHASAIAAYFNSEEGLAIRAILVTGTTVPHLDLRALRHFPIPQRVLTDTPIQQVIDDPAEPLHTVLDRLLWT
jgi:hypothetical protein